MPSGHALIAPPRVENNAGGGSSYIGAISTAGSTVAAVNLGHTGSSVVANGIPFVNAPGVSPSGSTWSVVGSAVDDGLANVGIDDLFFSEVWGLNPVRLTFGGLDPSHVYLVQILHGEPRNCCQGTYSNNTFSTDVDAAASVPVFTIGNGINGENPPATNDVAIVTTGISGATSFVYNAYSGVGRGGSMAGFQVRDLGPANLVTTTADSGPGSLREAILYTASGGSLSFDPSLAGATISLTGGALVCKRDLILDASGLPGGLALDAGGNSRVLEIAAGATVNVDSISMAGGQTPTAGGGQNASPGGAILNAGTLSLRSLALTGNRTGNGGAGTFNFETGGVPNGAGGDGGAVYNSGNLLVDSVTLSGNATGSSGGGGLSGGRGGHGGAIYNAGQLTIVNTTISENLCGSFGSNFSALPGAGGGIYNASAATITHSTISANASGANGSIDISTGQVGRANGGGIYQAAGATLDLENCIVAGNFMTGSNLFNAATAVVNESGSNRISGDPMLLPLGSFGGSTESMPPRPESTAIDAGGIGSLPTDQRGSPRNADGDADGQAAPDLGAVELQLAIVTTAVDENDVPEGVDLSLREALAREVVDLVVFVPSLSGQTLTLNHGELLIDRWVKIDASVLRPTLTIDAGGTSRVLRVANGANVTLDSLNITGGRTPDVASLEGSAASGGGIHNSGNLILRRMAIYANATGKGGPPDTSGFEGYGGDGGDGGGVFNSGELAVVNSTISGNTTGDGGGSASPDTSGGDAGAGAGIFNRGTLSLTHTTISGNTTGALGEGDIDPGRSRGGGLYNLIGSAQIENSIIAGNSVPPGGDGDNLYVRGGSITEAGVNLLSGDPMLAPLGSYGGPTLTMRLLAGSPAVDVAIDDGVTVTDQRGFHRPIGSSGDIGAVENVLPSFSPDLGEAGVGLSPTFSWTTFPGASYEIFVDFGSGLEPVGATSGSSIGLQGGLDPNTIYSWRIDVTVGADTITGDVSSFITRSPRMVTTELDEDDGGLDLGAGNSLRELILYSDPGGNLIHFSPSVDDGRIMLTGGELLIENQW
ncbi:MAG: choice-of-anchor Q domain-containing protein, partial [Verrucomicrobiales bacterium]